MKNLIGIGLALAATSSFATATGGPNGETPNPYLADAKVTYAAGKGITFDGGDSFKATLSHRVQGKWRYISAENMPNTNGFQMRRVRQKVKGHLFSKDVTFVIQVDHMESVATKDAWLKWAFLKGEGSCMSLRIGQGKTRGGVQSDGTSGGLFFVERSSATRTFADARSTGALLEGSAMEEQLGWWAGIFNTDTAGASTAAAEEGTNAGEHEVNFAAGVRFSPQGLGSAESRTEGDLAHTGNMHTQFGAGVFVGNERAGGADVEITSININAAVKAGNGIAGQAEVWIRSEDIDGAGESDSTGWYAQGSWTAAPEEGKTQLGAGVRVSMVDLSDVGTLVTGAGGLMTSLVGAMGDVMEINAVVNQFYHGHALKSQFGYTFQDVNPDGGTSTTNHGLEFMVTGSF